MLWAENCFCFDVQNIFGAKQVNSGRNGEKHQSRLSCFGLIKENMELPHIHLSSCIKKKHELILHLTG